MPLAAAAGAGQRGRLDPDGRGTRLSLGRRHIPMASSRP
jgi:hypothetical protein